MSYKRGKDFLSFSANTLSATTIFSGSTNINDLLGQSNLYENGLTKTGGTVILHGSVISATTLTLANDFSINISGQAESNTFSLVKGNFGTDEGEDIISLRNDGASLSNATVDLKIGPRNGADIASSSRIFVGSNNLTGLTGGNPHIIAIGNNSLNSYSNGDGLSVSIGNNNLNLADSAYDAFVGHDILKSATAATGSNSAIGYNNATAVRSIGSHNSFLGSYNVYQATDVGIGNSIMGTAGFNVDTIGNYNILMGYAAGAGDISSHNVIIGSSSVNSLANPLVDGQDDYNVFIGQSAFKDGNYTSSGTNRTTAIGISALRHGGGVNNTVVGRAAGWGLDGRQNTVLGYRAGRSSDTAFNSSLSNTIFSGTNSTFVGINSGYQSSAASITNTVVLGPYYAQEAYTTYIASTGSIKFAPNTSGGDTATLFTWPSTLAGAGQVLVDPLGDGNLDWEEKGFFSGGITANTIINTGGKIENLAIVTGVTSYTANTSQEILSVNVASGITISLPSAPSIGQSFIIKDTSGGAQTNNITVTVNNSTYLIDGAGVDIISENYASARYVFDGNIYMIL